MLDVLIVHLRRTTQLCMASPRPSEGSSADSAQVPRVPGPRGLAGPFHQMARIHAGPRIVEEARERV